MIQDINLCKKGDNYDIGQNSQKEIIVIQDRIPCNKGDNYEIVNLLEFIDKYYTYKEQVENVHSIKMHSFSIKIQIKYKL